MNRAVPRRLSAGFEERLVAALQLVADDEMLKIMEWEIIPVMSAPAPNAEPVVSMTFFLLRPSRDPDDWIAKPGFVMDPYIPVEDLARQVKSTLDKLREEYWASVPKGLQKGPGNDR